MQDDSFVIRKFEETLRLSGLSSHGDPDLTYRVSSPSESANPFVADSGFELKEEIGSGGMGVVYRAHQKSLGRDVAIKKVKKSGGKSAVAEAAFVAEARVTGILDHPNIVPVHELGRGHDGETFLAMKLVGGRSWSDLLHDADSTLSKSSALDIVENIGILINVCNALCYAHAKGVIHRDLKPSNVMVGEFGEVFVMDWGLSVVLDDRFVGKDTGIPRAEEQTHIVGTPSYMAPEMAIGDPSLLGPWTDVYLLGAILFELLTGAAPHSGDSLHDTVIQASRGKIPQLPTDLPLDIREVCRRSMAREISERYQSVEIFRENLQAFLRHRESAQLSTIAVAHLDTSKERVAKGPRTSGIYTAVTDAIAGFKQALLLWDENDIAKIGLQEALVIYAEVALQRDDLILAHTMAEFITGDRGRDLVRLIEKQRDQKEVTEKQRRRLRIALAILAIVIVVGLAIGFVLIKNEKDRADASARAAQHESELRAKALDDVVRLSDIKRIANLTIVAARISSPQIGNLEALNAWIDEGHELLGRLAVHRETLNHLRASATAVKLGPERGVPSLEQQDRLIKDIERRIGLIQKQLTFVADKNEKDAVQRALLRAELERDFLLSQNFPKSVFELEKFEDQWQHDALVELIAKLEHFGKKDVGLFDRTKRYRDEIVDLERQTLVQPKEKWGQALQRISESKKYDGEAIRPQLGLIPLGSDPESGLEEFLHWPTHDGPLPWRDERGYLHLSPLTGIVFVFLPGGECWRGAQNEFKDGYHFDGQARDNEGPVHTLVLDPFFISKYELTQGQWLNRFDTQPSFYGSMFFPNPDTHLSLLHPLENRNWSQIKKALDGMGVDLPTEAQWEYAARAGTDSVWWVGNDREKLIGCANLPDQSAKTLRATWSSLKDWPELNDGYGVHAPADALRPNPFGLHHVIGNVSEFCRDRFSNYELEVNPGDGAVLEWSTTSRIVRGGSFDGPIKGTRSAAREYFRESEAHSGCGVRPSLRVAQ
ncbi:MAG: serine/threonine protein kinase/formylglycine-generating enzyme required for sulfatase activity [Planctomycetota bacterium]|jgi:serine/threonine protein kinase/formylglycine-generating enzyme required for sulfatase activity